MQKFASKLHVDWFRVLTDLHYRGLRSQVIADRIGVARSTILGWKQGAEPKHADGELLLALWMHVTERARGDLSMVSVPRWHRRR